MCALLQRRARKCTNPALGARTSNATETRTSNEHTKIDVPPQFGTSQLPKVVWQWRFFRFRLGKSWKWFEPQWHAIFKGPNFQKCSEPLAFLTFCIENVLRATAACNFWNSQLPKVLRTWCVLYILTRKRASCYSSVQFFISHLARWLRTRRFSEPTFGPSRPTNHSKKFEKHSVSGLSSDSFPLLLFPSLCLFLPLLFISPYCQKFDS